MSGGSNKVVIVILLKPDCIGYSIVELVGPRLSADFEIYVKTTVRRFQLVLPLDLCPVEWEVSGQPLVVQERELRACLCHHLSGRSGERG